MLTQEAKEHLILQKQLKRLSSKNTSPLVSTSAWNKAKFQHMPMF